MNLHLLSYTPPSGVARFQHGRFVATSAVIDLLRADPLTGQGIADIATIGPYLLRHLTCDWGDVCPEDRDINDEALREGHSILSIYTLTFKRSVIALKRAAGDGLAESSEPSDEAHRVWIHTEGDRSVTTVLLPNDY